MTLQTDAVYARLDELLSRAFADSGLLLLVGDHGGRLRPRESELFTVDPSPRVREVLALGLEEAVLAEAARAADDLGLVAVSVLVEASAGEGVSLDIGRPELHRAGLFVAGAERLLWEPSGASGAVSRSARLEAETSTLLVRCVRGTHPEGLARLEQAVVSLQHDVDLQRQLEIDHARTREAERERAERLKRLERLVDEATTEKLAAEVELLRSQLDEIQATRVWRMGQSWWRFRDRFRRRGG